MIAYTFEVVSTDTASKTMEVRYSAAGLSTLTVSAPLPVVGQDINEVISAYAPIGFWDQETAVVQTVTVGHAGSLSFDKNPPAIITSGPAEVSPEVLKAQAQIAFEKKLAAALIKFGLLTTDPTV